VHTGKPKAYVSFVLRSISGATSVLLQSNFMLCRSYEICFQWIQNLIVRLNLRGGYHRSTVHMLLSMEAVSASHSSRTLKFQGEIQGHSVVILVDSGSSHSFVNQSLASSLTGVSALSKSVIVQVANGQATRYSVAVTLVFHPKMRVIVPKRPARQRGGYRIRQMHQVGFNHQIADWLTNDPPTGKFPLGLRWRGTGGCGFG
jgi:hypothetical protein